MIAFSSGPGNVSIVEIDAAVKGGGLALEALLAKFEAVGVTGLDNPEVRKAFSQGMRQLVKSPTGKRARKSGVFVTVQALAPAVRKVVATVTGDVEAAAKADADYRREAALMGAVAGIVRTVTNG